MLLQIIFSKFCICYLQVICETNHLPEVKVGKIIPVKQALSRLNRLDLVHLADPQGLCLVRLAVPNSSPCIGCVEQHRPSRFDSPYQGLHESRHVEHGTFSVVQFLSLVRLCDLQW